MNSFDYLLKYIVIGDVSVGKTCFVSRFLDQEQFKDNYDPTIGVEFAAKNLNVQSGKKTIVVKAQIWDTAGQESFKSITRNYYKGAIGAILVYDVTKKQSFVNIQCWYDELLSVSNQVIEIVVVANKSEVDESQREVSKAEGEEFSKKIGKRFYECSARTGQNIQLVFQKIADTIVQKIEEKKLDPMDSHVGIKLGKRGRSNSPNKNGPSSIENSAPTNKYTGAEKMYTQCYC